jgi:hypothetical protein
LSRWGLFDVCDGRIWEPNVVVKVALAVWDNY